MEPKLDWNGASGEAWVTMQPVLDAMLEPFIPVLLDHALEDGVRDVLDVGCGAGATTLAAARALGTGGACTGIDISDALIDAARARASLAAPGTARFIRADAQTHAFEPAAFDAVLSRFGVMFFPDPVAAFANLRRAARPGGRLAFVAWRSPRENAFMTLAARTAAPLLPSLVPPDPDAPGQWAFADDARVRGILASSGWKDVAIEPVDVATAVPVADLDDYLARLGPVGLALQAADVSTRERVMSSLRAAYAPTVEDGAARFTCACWLGTARV